MTPKRLWTSRSRKCGVRRGVLSRTSLLPAPRANLVKAARDDGPEKVTELWLKAPFVAPAMEPARLAPRLRRLARENAHCWLGNPVLQRSPKPLAAKRLDEIKVPTLLILGKRDLPQAQATIETLRKG